MDLRQHLDQMRMTAITHDGGKTVTLQMEDWRRLLELIDWALLDMSDGSAE